MDPGTLPRGRRDTRSKRWPLFLGLSVLLHAPLTPLVALLGLLGWLARDDLRDVPAGPPITAIPVDLLSEEEAGRLMQPQSEPAAPSEPEPVVKEPDAPRRPPRDPVDAGAPVDAGTPADAGAPDAAVAEADAGARDGGALAEGRDAGVGAGLGDPIGVSGVARRVVDPNANVSVLVDTEKLRGHRLGARVGALLGGVYQWRDFFGPTGLDPVRDIDRMLIAGPQLRDSSQVVAVIQHHVPAARMRQALDLLVASDTEGGAWLDAGVPVATARADRAERFFVMPSARLVVVTPKSALESAKRLARGSIPALPGSQIATAQVATPWRAFIGVPFRVPKSIRWARMRLSPLSAGGAVIDVEALDESAELAAQHAPELTRAAEAATQLDLGILGALLGQKPQRFVQSVRFDADGARIVGQIVLTEAQVLNLLDLAGMMLAPPRPRRASDAGAVRSAPLGPNRRP